LRHRFQLPSGALAKTTAILRFERRDEFGMRALHRSTAAPVKDAALKVDRTGENQSWRPSVARALISIGPSMP
jgi:hypothetical protein